MGKKWGNALGGWRKQKRNRKGQFGGGGVKVTPAGGSKTKKKKRIKPYDQWSPKAKTAFHAAAIVGSIGLATGYQSKVPVDELGKARVAVKIKPLGGAGKRHTRRARAAAQRGRAPAAPPVDFGNLSSVR